MLLNMIYVSDFPSNVARTQRVFAYAPKGESGHVVIIINPHKSNYSYLRDGYVLSWCWLVAAPARSMRRERDQRAKDFFNLARPAGRPKIG